MSSFFTVWIFLGALTGLVWLGRFLSVGPALRRQTPLTPESHSDAEGGAKLSVLVAARNEERTIETCVRTLLAQDYPDFEIIVANDRSTDRTAEILRKLEQDAKGRLTALHVDGLPAGWFGKCHAMHLAGKRAHGEWLVLTDADCKQLSTRTLAIAVREAEKHGADCLSITPMLEVQSVWERVFQPAVALTLIFWFLPDRVNDPKKPTAYANGAFILIRRRCYDAIGGHEQVRATLNEDIHLARRVKGMGFKLRVASNRGLYSTRMYSSMREAWRGWSRIFCGCLESVPRLATAGALVLFVSVLPVVSVIVAMAGWLTSTAENARVWSLSAAVWGLSALCMHATLWRIYPVTGTGRWWALLYGIGAAGTLAALMNAILKAAGFTGVQWRGATYDGRSAAAPQAIGVTKALSAVEPDLSTVPQAEAKF